MKTYTLACSLVLLLLADFAFGQEPQRSEPKKVVRKIKINSADPQLIALLLSKGVDFRLTSEITKLPR